MKTLVSTFAIFLCACQCFAQQPPDGLMPAERGKWFILNKPYLIPDFDDEIFQNLWKSWPKEEREQAAQLAPEERREKIFNYYGLTTRPGEESDKPLQYVVSRQGKYYMNCFSCHGGKVEGKVIPGRPNSDYALQTLSEDIRKTKNRLSQPLNSRDMAAMFFPMGGSVGTTNAVMFGVALESFRDHDMRLRTFSSPPQLVHHDMDAPPLWHFSKKEFLYLDGFVEKDHRALMPFVLIRENSREDLDRWESDFRDIFAYLESIEPPKYPYDLNHELAETGKAVFLENCAECHGTYGDSSTYPERIVPLEEIGTDPVRYRALTQKHRENYAESWLSHYGEKKILENPAGYVAPPLDGIWASAPYFHNGSVPTLESVLNPEKRPNLWKKTSDRFNQQSVGYEYQEFEEIPPNISPAEKRRYFDTKKRGKSNSGHLYPQTLTEPEKKAILEYLKTL